jgi:hypothetical protein
MFNVCATTETEQKFRCSVLIVFFLCKQKPSLAMGRPHAFNHVDDAMLTRQINEKGQRTVTLYHGRHFSCVASIPHAGREEQL